MSKRLQGKVAFITGAASGIGFASAKRYAQEGAKILGFDLNPCANWHEVEELAEQAIFVQGDVTDFSQLQAAVQSAVDTLGKVDILLTAAGVADAGPVHMVEEAAWERVIDINLKGTFLSIKAVLPTMMEQKSGSIITVASIEGIVGSEGGSSYNASKGGVVLLTKNMAMDYGRVGIRCNAVCPGFIETPLFHSMIAGEPMQEVKERIRFQHKLGRFGKPEEIAGAVYFLASEDASFVSGQALCVDGGFTAGKSFGITAMMGLE